ncbi:transposase [Neochlamydia sp. AcF65]|uniref:transposase n=1 Tax=Neochlamydia sp. AcF65 TaxID=2795735 RepID=UPI001BC9FAF1|nr:transposase [Neochlamydia sp. AcF65]
MHFCDVKTKKEKRQSSITKNQHFRALIQQAVTNQVKFEYVLADNWFGAKDNMKLIHSELKKMFIFGIKSNRLIALSEEQRKKGQYQNLNTFNFKDGDKRIVWHERTSFPRSFNYKDFQKRRWFYKHSPCYD